MHRNLIMINRWLVKLQQYFDQESTLKHTKAHPGIVCLKVLWLTLRMFVSERLDARASALSYTTLLALVPIMAIVFAVANGFGVASYIESLLLNNFAGQEEAIQKLMNSADTYLKHTRSGVFLGVGFGMLVYTVVQLTGSVEEAFNDIWQVKKQRSPFRKITSYFSVLVLLPFLLVILSGINVFLSTIAEDMKEYIILGDTTRFFIKLTPYLISSMLMSGLYIFMPNTRVRLSCALWPGVLCGITFELFMELYINSQIWVTNYNAIYGSFAALPMFLFWARISWCICLFGAELSFAIQNRRRLGDRYEGRQISRDDHDFACVLILALLTQRFRQRQQGVLPYSADELAERLNLPIRLVNNLLYDLIRMRWIYALDHTKEETERYQLAWDLSDTTLEDVISTFNHYHERRIPLNRHGEFAQEWALYNRSQQVFSDARQKLRITDLIRPLGTAE